MSSTTVPTRFGRTLSRPILITILTVIAVAAAAVLAVLALTGVDGRSSVRPASSSDGSKMPTPQWLERYLQPRVTDGELGVPVPVPTTRPVNRGLY